MNKNESIKDFVKSFHTESAFTKLERYDDEQLREIYGGVFKMSQKLVGVEYSTDRVLELISYELTRRENNRTNALMRQEHREATGRMEKVAWVAVAVSVVQVVSRIF